LERIDRIINNEKYIAHLLLTEEIEQSRQFCGHGRDHLISAARIAWILNLEMGLGLEKDVVYAAGLLHDIGRDVQYEKGVPHELASAEIAPSILSECGYNPEEIDRIVLAISLHRTKEIAAEESLSGILYRADKLSRACFWCKADKDCKWPEQKKNRGVDF